MSIALVIFDIAGTIIEDRGEVVRAFADALAKNGIQAEPGQLKKWKGAAKREVIRSFADGRGEPFVEAVYADFLSALRHSYRSGIRPIAGAERTFDWLRSKDIGIALTTGFDSGTTAGVLASTGWRPRLSAVVTSSDVSRGRPSPEMIHLAMRQCGITDPATVVNVGDTVLDLQAGTNAGVRGVIGVLTGEQDRALLEREPHTHLLASVAELPALLEREFRATRT